MIKTSESTDRPGILHAVWWEGVTSSGLIENQLYRPLRYMAKQYPEYRWMLYSAGPFFKVALRDWLLRNPGLARFIPNAQIRNRLNPNLLGAELMAQGISYFPRETGVAPKSICLRYPLQMTFPWLHVHDLGRVIDRRNVRIVHCRSYGAAWVALLTRKWTHTRFRLIFDMRGLLPEEGVLLGAYSREGASFRRWKKVEKMLLDQSDLILAPSDTFAEYVQTLTANPSVHTVYTHSPVDQYREIPADPAWLRKFPALKGKPILAYLGSLGPNSWHSIDYLANQFAAFRQVMGSAALLLITQGHSQWLRRKLAELSIPENDYVLTGTNGVSETASLLKLARYGALPYRPITSPEEKLIGHTMIASKTGEYLAAGLPLICHPGIGSAARMIESERIGCLYDGVAPSVLLQEAVIQAEKEYAGMRKRCLMVARRFDLQRNVARYGELYSALIGR